MAFGDLGFVLLLWADTESSGHAQKIASEILLNEFDAIVSISGDGTLHELINGLAQHKEPMRAFRIPIAPIPAGSGNGTSLNVLGIKVRA
jgi:sphingosine kinase